VGRDKDTSKMSGKRDPFPVRMKRMFSMLFKFLILIPGVILSLWLGYRLHYFLFLSPFFQLRKVEVLGVSDELNGEILENVRMDHLGLHYYNLLKLRVGPLRDRLQTMPRLRTVRIYKDYPSILRILVQPRKGMILVAGKGLFLADSEGMIMEKVKPEKIKEYCFPVVTGLKEEEIAPGKIIKEEAFFKALDIQAGLLKHRYELYDRLSEFNLNARGDITAVFQGGTEIRFGRKNPLDKLPDLDAFITKYAPGNQDLTTFKYVDLRFNKQIVYALRDTR